MPSRTHSLLLASALAALVALPPVAAGATTRTVSVKDDYFAVTKGGLLFGDFSAWGTLFLIVGIIELLVGLGIFALKTWARATGVLLLMLNTIVQFAFIAAFPIWTLAAIIINITAICALMRPLEDYQQPRGYIE